MANRTIVKENWEEALMDELSEGFWTLWGYFVLGGILVTIAGASVGYVSTPKGEEPLKNMAGTAAAYHGNVWKGAAWALTETGKFIYEMRPSNNESPEVSTTDVAPTPPREIPVEPVQEPVRQDVEPWQYIPEVGECDPYGPMDFSYDPPRLVCETLK